MDQILWITYFLLPKSKFPFLKKYCPKLRFLPKMEIFCEYFHFSTKMEIFDDINFTENFGPKFWTKLYSNILYIICSTVYKFDGTKWDSCSSINIPRASPAIVVINDHIFAIGGIGVNQAPSDKIELYDGKTWTLMTPFLGELRLLYKMILLYGELHSILKRRDF